MSDDIFWRFIGRLRDMMTIPLFAPGVGCEPLLVSIQLEESDG